MSSVGRDVQTAISCVQCTPESEPNDYYRYLDCPDKSLLLEEILPGMLDRYCWKEQKRSGSLVHLCYLSQNKKQEAQLMLTNQRDAFRCHQT